MNINLNLDECSICLDNMNENNIKLKCNHYFHINCIFDWSRNNNNIYYNNNNTYIIKGLCPICNTSYNEKIIIINKLNKKCCNIL